jgi:hypothetical protein
VGVNLERVDPLAQREKVEDIHGEGRAGLTPIREPTVAGLKMEGHEDRDPKVNRRSMAG